MTNLLSTLSETLQNKLSDYKVYNVFVEYGEVNVFSEYDLDYSFITAIENEIAEVRLMDLSERVTFKHASELLGLKSRISLQNAKKNGFFLSIAQKKHAARVGPRGNSGHQDIVF